MGNSFQKHLLSLPQYMISGHGSHEKKFFPNKIKFKLPPDVYVVYISMFGCASFEANVPSHKILKNITNIKSNKSIYSPGEIIKNQSFDFTDPITNPGVFKFPLKMLKSKSVKPMPANANLDEIIDLIGKGIYVVYSCRYYNTKTSFFNRNSPHTITPCTSVYSKLRYGKSQTRKRTRRVANAKLLEKTRTIEKKSCLKPEYKILFSANKKRK